MVSARTRCETQAPFATNASAASTCPGSSRVIRRTSRFVSIACMLALHARADALLELHGRVAFRRPVEQARVDVLGAVEADTTDQDRSVRALLPGQHRAGREAELPPHVGRNGDLRLGTELGASV